MKSLYEIWGSRERVGRHTSEQAVHAELLATIAACLRLPDPAGELEKIAAALRRMG